MRGRNTEDYEIEEHKGMANYQRKWHVVMEFIHGEEYIVFNDIGEGRRKKEVYDVTRVIIAMN